MKMRFREDGTFKIMQITDMQEIPAISKDTIALMERAILEEQPDLVVYTGDQIKGYGVTYKGKGEELEREVAQTIGKLLEPVTKRGIPFAVTFGNHDCPGWNFQSGSVLSYLQKASELHRGAGRRD